MRAPELLEERARIIRDAHALGHFGREAIYKQITAEGLWWPGLRNEIELLLKQCDDCLKYTVAKRGFHPSSFVHSRLPWDHIMIDTATNLPESVDGKTVLLVVVDVFTGFVILRALPNKEMETVARELWSIFALLGLPRIIQSDNGTEFVNQVLEALVRLCGIEHRTIAEYNPRADGKVERSVGTALVAIKKRLHGHQRNWSLFVDYAQLSINAKIASLTNSSPFALMFGRALNPMRDYTQDPPLEIDLDEWTAHQERISSLILPAINEHVGTVKSKQMQRLDTIRRQLAPASLPAGSTVMLKNIYKRTKFDPEYLGPYTIERRARSGTYVLRDGMGDILDRRVPVDQIKMVSRTPLPRNEDDPIFEVNEIVDHRGTPGNYEYLVDWKGYSIDDRTWEPEANIIEPKPVSEYWARINPPEQRPARQPRRPRRRRADRQ
jgi:transposase InsO family protein